MAATPSTSRPRRSSSSHCCCVSARRPYPEPIFTGAYGPDTFVCDGTLAVLVAEVRRALGDSAREPAFIRTVNRFGYAFLSTALSGDGRAREASSPACWLLRGSERFRLRPGENILGRDVSVDVVIDAVGVSRRHAAIDVGQGGATLRDLSSKNGTFLDGRRITASAMLRDNVEVRLGAVSLRFRRPMAATVTDTVEEWDDLRGAS